MWGGCTSKGRTHSSLKLNLARSGAFSFRSCTTHVPAMSYHTPYLSSYTITSHTRLTFAYSMHYSVYILHVLRYHWPLNMRYLQSLRGNKT